MFECTGVRLCWPSWLVEICGRVADGLIAPLVMVVGSTPANSCWISISGFSSVCILSTSLSPAELTPESYGDWVGDFVCLLHVRIGR